VLPETLPLVAFRHTLGRCPLQNRARTKNKKWEFSVRLRFPRHCLRSGNGAARGPKTGSVSRCGRGGIEGHAIISAS